MLRGTCSKGQKAARRFGGEGAGDQGKVVGPLPFPTCNGHEPLCSRWDGRAMETPPCILHSVLLPRRPPQSSLSFLESLLMALPRCAWELWRRLGKCRQAFPPFPVHIIVQQCPTQGGVLFPHPTEIWAWPSALMWPMEWW